LTVTGRSPPTLTSGAFDVTAEGETTTAVEADGDTDGVAGATDGLDVGLPWQATTRAADNATTQPNLTRPGRTSSNRFDHLEHHVLGELHPV
jgi:hypothetical protein